MKEQNYEQLTLFQGDSLASLIQSVGTMRGHLWIARDAVSLLSWESGSMIKPILFNTDMVRAILANRKTVTRRVVKPQPRAIYYDGKIFDDDGLYVIAENQNGGLEQIVPPYRPGDILYVREAWRIWRAHRYDADAHIEFKAGGEGTILRFPHGCTDSVNRDDYDSFIQKWGVGGKWRPAIHMPREAARIFLRVTNVYPQRLKDVTETDARAEGFHSRAEFMSAVLKMYPECMEDSWFWANEFERISREEANCGS